MFAIAVSGGGDSGEAVAEPYAELLDAAERRFREAADAGDIDGMVAGWNELTDILGHVAHGNARLGTALLGTVVKTTGLSPEDAITKTIALIESS